MKARIKQENYVWLKIEHFLEGRTYYRNEAGPLLLSTTPQYGELKAGTG